MARQQQPTVHGAPRKGKSPLLPFAQRPPIQQARDVVFAGPKFLFRTLDHLPPALLIPVTGTIELCGLMPVANYACDHLDAAIRGGTAAAMQFPTLGTAVGVAGACLGLGLFLFGRHGLLRNPPKADAVAEEITFVTGERFVHQGFVGGIVAPLQQRHKDDVLFAHPAIGTYTLADPKVWGLDFLLNCAFYPAMALILGFPMLDMAIPALGLSTIATLATARMTKIWAAEGKIDHIKWGRIGVFSTVNAFAALAASGLVTSGVGWGVQASVGAMMATMTFLMVKPTPIAPPREDARALPLEEAV